jgi:hypothetical protein
MIRAMLDSEQVAALRAEGHSFRAIAILLGASLGAVQRALKRRADAEAVKYGYDDEDDPDALPGDDYEPIAQFVFVGLAVPEDRRGEPLRDGNGRVFGPCPRAVDGRGVSVGNPDLEMWRWCAHARAEGDYEAAEAVEADWARQLAAAGVSCDESGRWRQAPRAR